MPNSARTRALRIAQVSPLTESVPPHGYGGTERVVSYLTEELVRLGHRVTLFASGDSRTSAELVGVGRRALRGDPDGPIALAMHTLLTEEVFRRADSFDVIHFHADCIHLPLARRHATPCLTTLHGRLDLPCLAPLYREFAEAPLVSISWAQRRPLPFANWLATVHHGLPPVLYAPSFHPGRYLAFLGRLSPEKRADRAVAIARRAGLPLRIAAKIDPTEVEYFRSQLEPLIDGRFVEYVGEIGDHEKCEFLRDATALLFPIDWPEPFGLAMIEAMACGTPVIAFDCGSVREIVDEGVTGYVVHGVEEAVARLRQIDALDRRYCRAGFERRFTAERMALEYCALYEWLSEPRWQLRA